MLNISLPVIVQSSPFSFECNAYVFCACVCRAVVAPNENTDEFQRSATGQGINDSEAKGVAAALIHSRSIWRKLNTRLGLLLVQEAIAQQLKARSDGILTESRAFGTSFCLCAFSMSG